MQKTYHQCNLGLFNQTFNQKESSHIHTATNSWKAAKELEPKNGCDASKTPFDY
jgi:hypothetical protein